MTEAVELLLEYGFSKLKLQQIEAFTSFKNAPSIALLKKFDFKLNETRKDEDNDDNLIFELKPSS
jgi:ribosomal-protein-alanine N-acetyltransferase